MVHDKNSELEENIEYRISSDTSLGILERLRAVGLPEGVKRAKLQEKVDASIDRFMQELDKVYDNPQLLYWHNDSKYRLNPLYFRDNSAFIEDALNRYVERGSKAIFVKYKKTPERIPLDFADKDEARHHLREVATEYLMELNSTRKSPHSSLSMQEAAEAFVRARLGATFATFTESGATKTLIMYDYDKKIYTFADYIVKEYMHDLFGAISVNRIKDFISSLEGVADRLAIYNPVPKYKVPVGNGLYNALDSKLEPYTPLVTVTSKIQTNYVADAQEPLLANGMSFDRLVSDLANNNYQRVELIYQICKTIITGYSPNPAGFIFLGPGGDGKSLFMQLISNVIGASNCGILSFSDLDQDDKLLQAAGTRLILGPDNDEFVRVQVMAILKSLITHDEISISRKYLPAISLRYEGTLVQLCNTLPVMKDNGNAVRRRLMVVSCENSHYAKNNEIHSLAETIKNKHWHEFILKTILEAPYFSDYNDVDRHILNQNLDENDSVGLFMQEFVNQELITDKTTVIHKALMYSAYLDWFNDNYTGNRPVSSRTFGNQMADFLKPYGFKAEGGSLRMSTIESIHDISFSKWFGEFATGPNVAERLEKGGTSRVLIKAEGNYRNVSEAVRRNGARTSRELADPAEYFSIFENVVTDVSQNPSGYKDLIEKHFEGGLEFEDTTRDYSIEFNNAMVDKNTTGSVEGSISNVIVAYEKAKERNNMHRDEQIMSLVDARVNEINNNSFGKKVLERVRRYEEQFLLPKRGGKKHEEYKDSLTSALIDGGYENLSEDDLINTSNKVVIDFVRKNGFVGVEDCSNLVKCRILRTSIPFDDWVQNGDDKRFLLAWLNFVKSCANDKSIEVRTAFGEAVDKIQRGFSNVVSKSRSEKLLAKETALSDNTPYTKLEKIINITDKDI